MEVKYCPYCGFESSIKRKRCGWKYYCDECNKLIAILDVSAHPGGLMPLFDAVLDTQEKLDYVPKKYRREGDKGVSL